jgi:prepilin-type N-terminal cleavage/methylation domain-containing protein/prepilin-type processing-associated H-X9-DG protein
MKRNGCLRSRSERGFTLIELLVVISIISLLVSILLPSLSMARQQAKSAVCLANLKRLATAMVIYMNDNDEMFPPFRKRQEHPSDTELYRNRWGRLMPRWQWFLHDEVQPVIDPWKYGAEPPNGSPAFDAALEMDKEHYLDPALQGQYARDIRNGAYGYNYQYLGNARVTDGQFQNYPVRETKVRSASMTVLIADSRGAELTHGQHAYTLDPPRLAHEKNATRFGPSSQLGIPFSPVEMRHLNKGNVSFVDGHAETMTYDQLGYATDENGAAISTEGTDVVGATNRLWTGSARDPFGRRNP